MAKREIFARHQVIIKKLRTNPCSFREMSDKLQSEAELQDMDLRISERTFQRDIKEIRTLYGIDIKFNRSEGVYEITEDSKDEYHERMFEALDIFQALQLGQSFSNFIQFDTRKALGSEHLSGLLHAIQNRYQIRFIYEKFKSDKTETRTVEPYLLKEFKRRWYIFAYDINKKEFRTFGLDRIKGLQIQPIKFQFPQKIKPKKYFENSYGIVGSYNKKPQEIILEFINNQGDYIRSLPLHHSQKILEDKNGTMKISLKLVPTFDFIIEILGYADSVKVLQPESLAEQIKIKLQNALKIYS